MGAIVTRSKGSAKPKPTEESSSPQNTGNVTVRADRPTTDLTNVAKKSEGSPKAEADEPNQSQAVTVPEQADKPNDINEEGSQSYTTEDGTKAIKTTDQEMEKLRAKMELYKDLYDTGQLLPLGTDDEFYPDYVKENSKLKAQIVDWMLEYSIPELYLKTLESTTYTTWLGEKSTWLSPYSALFYLHCHISSSKILADRLLSAGYLNYAINTLTDQKFIANFKDNQRGFADYML